MLHLTDEQIEQLAEKKLMGGLTPEEEALLDQWLSERQGPEDVVWDSADKNEQQLKARLLARIRASAEIDVSPKRKVFPLLWKAAAVMIPIVLASAFFYSLIHHEKRPSHPAALIDIAPGSNGAVLLLANGKTLKLDSTVNGIIASQQGSNLVIRNGALVHEQTGGGQGNGYNTVTTPFGNQFKLTLPDGTQAWLNAGSSIVYPVSFAADKRVVTVSGEVYLEVAKVFDTRGRRRPFIVTAGLSQVEVLGTHFNVRAYATDADIKTTLAEGSVRVSIPGQAPAVLSPDHQSIIDASHHTITAKEVDAAAVIAWTRGFFSFRNADIKEVMEQLARWYNVRIVYEKDLPTRSFSGKIYRNINISAALDALAFMNVKFSIENNAGGTQIRVMP
ncbi:MAG TPA: FecR domain-containing protein [Chitinophaga sp.]|uniref:FecR family protein n=1 Tax=Chitinophaga sp. TaxID=1869181 RepID=UPI002BB633FD|nr:FecR domain-containing protein [Chitinophaga sp.]HVI43930.1 FecR domain-containing protein [Chitinophaga sp.]